MPCQVLGKHTIVDLFGQKDPLIASHALPSMQYCYEKSIFAKQITKKNNIYIYIRLKIKPNSVRIRSLKLTNVCSSLDRI
jgi:hypothetical protein